MYQLKNLNKIANVFAKQVIKKSKDNLVSLGKADGNLYKNLNSKVTDIENGVKVVFDMPDYGEFQDKGVDGVKKKYGAKSYDGRSLSYTDKMPPPSKLDKWIVRKGIAPRNKKGQFKGRTISNVGFAKSIQFLIARGIFINGIRPSLFFTKPFNNEMKEFKNKFNENFLLDVDIEVKKSIKNKK